MVNHNRFGRAADPTPRSSGSFIQRPRPAGDFAPWIKRQSGPAGRSQHGAIVVFPHAGAAASSYRTLAKARPRSWWRHLRRAVPTTGRAAQSSCARDNSRPGE